MPYTPSSWADGPSGNTPITAAKMSNLESQYTQAMADAGNSFEQKGVAIQVKESPITPYRYGAVNPVAGSDNTTALTAWANALAGSTYPSGAAGYLPPGLWRYNSSTGLPLNNNTVITGAGIRSRLAAVGSSGLFEWNTAVSNVHMEDMWLECAVAGKAVFAPGSSGGIAHSRFKHLFAYASNDTAQIWSQNNGGSFIHMTFADCEFQRTATSTVVPFSVITTAGGANFNKFDQVQLDGANNTNTPFFHFESTLASTYLTDWTFINILGEQNTGGMIQVLAAYNWKLLNVTDEDSTAAYTGNLIEFKANGNGLGSRSINIENSGRRGQSMTSGKYDIYCDPATSTEVTIVNCNPTPTSQNPLLNIPVNSVVTGTRGYPTLFQGAGVPAFAAVVGSLFLRTDGGTGSTLYVKESGTGTTGWVAK